MLTADQWIEALKLEPLPEEGGWYREVYRSAERIPPVGLPDRFDAARTMATSIYYLLTSDAFSAFHRIRQDETWHFYAGCALTLHMIDRRGQYHRMRLGPDIYKGERFQITIDHGNLFAATVDPPHSFALLGCTVAPGFEFEDFEAPSRSELLAAYPAHAELIQRLTR